MLRAKTALLAILMVICLPIQALEFTSGSRQPVVIELFTSEGCSSCPPAEHWLNSLTQHPALWDQLFPLAWHVDYWDDIGWPDRYASPRYSARQWRYKQQTSLRSVYTPGVMRNGRAWRGWIRGGEPVAERGPATGVLHVEWEGDTVTAAYEPTYDDKTEGFILRAAILGFGLSTEVARGENAGRHLHHEFVVLAEQQLPATATGWAGSLPERLALAGEVSRLAVLFWLERRDSPEPVVVTGGWLPEGWSATEASTR